MANHSPSPPPAQYSRTSPKTNCLEDVIRQGFYAFVDTSGDCWEWKHAVNNSGYGRPRVLGINVLAHRLSWLIEYGEIPDGLLVLHKCDNRRCVRPDHLFLGTNLENRQDMIRKGRGSGREVLTTDQVIDIRRRYAAGGISTIKLAKEYNIGVTTVAGIIHRKTWAWLEEEAA